MDSWVAQGAYDILILVTNRKEGGFSSVIAIVR